MGAYQYIMTLFDAIDDLFHSPPYDQCKNDVFPDDFMQISRAIYKKLFRVYAHVYHHHLNVHLRRMCYVGIHQDWCRSPFEYDIQALCVI